MTYSLATSVGLMVSSSNPHILSKTSNSIADFATFNLPAVL
jgi:hypothetical protein